MICKQCHGHLGFRYTSGLSIIEICLNCGSISKSNRIIKALF